MAPARVNGSFWEEFMDCFAWEKRDRRLDDLPMMGSYWHIIYFNLAYLFCIKVAGPKVMANRPPVNSSIVLVYNGLQLIIRISIFTIFTYYFAIQENGSGWGEL